MIIRRADFKAALKRQNLDKTKYGHIGDNDQEIIARYSLRMLAVLVQAEALFWEQGGKVDTPARAALALALHEADPDIFDFPGCCCSPLIEQPCRPDCERRAFIDYLRWRARTPLPITGSSFLQRIIEWLRA